MAGRIRLFAMGAVVAMLAGAWTPPAAAAPWTRSFVVSSYEYAFRYGGRKDFSREGEIEPGVDCPHGSTVHFSNDAHVQVAVARQTWRSAEEIERISRPPGLDTVKTPNLTRFWIWDRALSYRGYRKGIETYVNPFAAEDPGQPQVVSRIGDGFNLDGKIGTDDFVSPDGEKGIDNALYRAWGCDAPWRGDGNATLHLRANDKMLEGLYIMVIRLSGNADPMNDNDVTVEIGYSPDHIVKDARGSVAKDYSYRIVHTGQYTKLKGKVTDGVLETQQVADLHAPRISWFYDQTGDAHFRQGKIRLAIGADGYASGLIGGYRNWRDLYVENTFAQDGGQQGIREHEDAVSLYYALSRNADGMADAKTGQKMGISTAYRIKASPAFVIDPDKPAAITVLTEEEPRKKAFDAVGDAFRLATTTRVVQDVPPGTTEAAVPAMERTIQDLPNKEYFLATLDRPKYEVEPEH